MLIMKSTLIYAIAKVFAFTLHGCHESSAPLKNVVYSYRLEVGMVLRGLWLAQPLNANIG